MKNNRDPFQTYWIECVCFSPEHIIRFVFNEQDKEIYMEPFLDHTKGFWGRFVDGIKYIFGHKSTYGNFDSVIIDLDTAIDLKNKLTDFTDKCIIDKLDELTKGVFNGKS